MDCESMLLHCNSCKLLMGGWKRGRPLVQKGALACLGWQIPPRSLRALRFTLHRDGLSKKKEKEAEAGCGCNPRSAGCGRGASAARLASRLAQT